MAVVNSRSVVNAIEMYGVTTIRLASTLGINLNQLIKSLFANNEQGFAYDPNDLSTMFQDAAGTVPVTAVGQPVGLMLDKSKGFAPVEVPLINPNFDVNLNGWVLGPSLTGEWENGQVRIVGAGTIGNPPNTLRSSTQGIANKRYEISFDATWVSGGYLQAGSSYREGIKVTPEQNSGEKKRYTFKIFQHPVDPYNICVFAAENSAVWLIDNVVVTELQGNNCANNTSSMRPLLVASPQRLDYDTVDDKLITTLSAQLTSCTVIRSVPGVGTQILTGQAIPATYEDNKDHCGLIVINRALTPSETSTITAEFNKRAGV